MNAQTEPTNLAAIVQISTMCWQVTYHHKDCGHERRVGMPYGCPVPGGCRRLRIPSGPPLEHKGCCGLQRCKEDVRRHFARWATEKAKGRSSSPNFGARNNMTFHYGTVAQTEYMAHVRRCKNGVEDWASITQLLQNALEDEGLSDDGLCRWEW